MSAEERSADETTAVSANGDEAATVSLASKPKYDWYQTESEVRINVLIKKLKQEDVQVNFQENLVSSCVLVVFVSELSQVKFSFPS